MRSKSLLPEPQPFQKLSSAGMSLACFLSIQDNSSMKITLRASSERSIRSFRSSKAPIQSGGSSKPLRLALRSRLQDFNLFNT